MTIQRLRGDQGADIKEIMNTKVKKQEIPGRSLIDLVLSWSINDVLNENLYEGQVKTIPLTFSSTTEYMKSLSIPLIKETHADLLASISKVSRAPFCKIVSVKKSKDYKPPHDFFYSIMLPEVRQFKNSKETYEPQNGDLIAITDVKPESVEDLDRPNRSYVVAYIQRVSEERLLKLSVLSSQPILVGEEKTKNKQTLYAVFLTNMTTNIRIWRALNSQLEGGNSNFIQEVLNPKSTDENPNAYLSDEKCRTAFVDTRDRIVSSDLNESQKAAVISCLVSKECNKNTVNLIWGPPGTGKTKTVAFLLFSLLKMKCRVLTCAPTNTAVLEVTRRLVKNVTESFEYVAYGLGDVVLYGNGERMKITDHQDLFDVFLDNRIEILTKCLVPSGWKDGLQSMICLLKDPKKEYRRYLEDRKVKEEEEEEEKKKRMSDNEGTSGNQGSNIKGQSSKEKKSMKFQKQVVQASNENQSKKKPKGMVPSKNEKKLKHEEKESGGCSSQVVIDNPLTFGEFLKGNFNRIVKPLRFCIVNLCKHLPTSFIPLGLVKNMAKALDVLKYLEDLLRTASVDDKGIEQVFSKKSGGGLGHLEKLRIAVCECLSILESLPKEFYLPKKIANKYAIKDFCLANARLIFCTVSSSIKLYREKMKPLELLVIDEAAQLKECESTIPLQLPGLRQVVLIGDERQLPAMVQSKVAENAEFGRSLFQRLVLLGHRRHLLNFQHRMHPSISLLPNREFYDNKILDGDNVKGKSNERRFLQGKMYGSYSFINVAHGKEELDGNSQSQKNMVEAAVVYEIVSSLVKAYRNKKVNVGIISPYNAQVDTISKMVKKLSTVSNGNVSISVRSVDGFQGGEEDVIIISTVRSNVNGAVGFLSNRQRANVALTRARHCLWIVGNGATLNNSGTVWTELVIDAKKRGCFYNADEDESLAKAITAALVKQNQMGSLLKNDSFLFRKTRWKVSFSTEFLESMSRFKTAEVLSLLVDLASGWRPPHSKKKLFVHHGISSSLLEHYKVNGSLILVWTVDIVKQNEYYIQILKIWDILPLSKMSQLANHIDVLFGNYTVDMINCCKQKCFERDLVVPMKWPIGSSSYPEANPVQSLLEPLASLSLRGDPETSFPNYW